MMDAEQTAMCVIGLRVCVCEAGVVVLREVEQAAGPLSGTRHTAK